MTILKFFLNHPTKRSLLGDIGNNTTATTRVRSMYDTRERDGRGELHRLWYNVGLLVT